jgi:ADP-ribosylglycohydrolase
VHDAAVIYSAAIGYLVRNYNEEGKQVLAFVEAQDTANALNNEECIEWLALCKKLATEADFKACKEGKNFLLGKYDAITNAGYLKHAFILSFFHLLLFHKCEPDDHSIFFELALRQTIQLGGDTDTNAAIVGAMVGAIVGVQE